MSPVPKCVLTDEDLSALVRSSDAAAVRLYARVRLARGAGLPAITVAIDELETIAMRLDAHASVLRALRVQALDEAAGAAAARATPSRGFRLAADLLPLVCSALGPDPDWFARSLRLVLDAYPSLDANGFRVMRPRSDPPGTTEPHPIDVAEYAVATYWLTRCGASKRLCATSSYGLKHLCEYDAGTYIANGALIAAAVAWEIPFRRVPGSPNALFYLTLPDRTGPDERLPLFDEDETPTRPGGAKPDGERAQ